jgi:hypothetical protein
VSTNVVLGDGVATMAPVSDGNRARATKESPAAIRHGFTLTPATQKCLELAERHVAARILRSRVVGRPRVKGSAAALDGRVAPFEPIRRCSRVGARECPLVGVGFEDLSRGILLREPFLSGKEFVIVEVVEKPLCGLERGVLGRVEIIVLVLASGWSSSQSGSAPTSSVTASAMSKLSIQGSSSLASVSRSSGLSSKS